MRLLRSGAGLGGFLLTILGAATIAAPGAEAVAGRCDPGTGVTVVVDYGALGRSTGLGCDPGGGGETANRVMSDAGFDITYTAGQPFVCRIDGLPDASQEQCNRTPPADAYWGLFWNDGKGGGWVYSSQGVASLEVPAGGSIGWRWQDGGDRDLPGAAPNPPGPTSTPSDPPAGGGGGGDKPGQDDSATPTPSPSASAPMPAESDSPSANKSAKPSDEAGNGKGDGKKDQDDKGKGDKQDDGEADADESASPSESATDDATVVATEPTSSSTDSSGDNALLLVAGAAVLVLGGTAAFLAWRRRA